MISKNKQSPFDLPSVKDMSLENVHIYVHVYNLVAGQKQYIVSKVGGLCKSPTILLNFLPKFPIN